MKTYRDGDSRFEIMRPGELRPTAYQGPTEGRDYAWVRPGIIDRWMNRRRGKSLAVNYENLRLATNYNIQTAEYVKSEQAIVHARNQERLLPLKYEAEETDWQLKIIQTEATMSDELERRERAQQEHKRRMAELKGERKATKSRNKQARRARRRARDAERRRSTYDQGPPPPTSGGAEAFQRHYQTHQHAAASLSEGRRRRREIYARAEAERRNLTEDEMLEVDAIDDAAEAGADEMRRTGASDLPPQGGRR
jgi:hypothetical protein